MNDRYAKKLSFKKASSTVLITLGIIGYLSAVYFFGYAIYFWIVTSLHPNAPEDQPAGLAGLGLVLEFGAGMVLSVIATLFFVPGMALRSKMREPDKK